MISSLLIKFWAWYALRILGFKYVVLRHDGTQTKLVGITFAHEKEYADEVESLSLANHRYDEKR